jgi:hypothetical protein
MPTKRVRVFSEEEKERRRIYNIKYRLDNPEKRKESCKKWCANNLENRKKHATSRKTRELNWKRSGVIMFEDIHEIYELATNCEVCNIEFLNKGSYRRCLDHHHASGHIRGIICNKCNINLGKVDNLTRKLLLDLHRYFNRNSEKFIFS